MLSFMERSSISRFMGAVILMLSAQMALAHNDEASHKAVSLPTHAEAFALLMQQGDQPFSTISSCQSVSDVSSEAVRDILGYYLSVLAQFDESRIKVTSLPESAHIRIAISFEVVDDESPWSYGFEFNVESNDGHWNTVSGSLRCTGM